MSSTGEGSGSDEGSGSGGGSKRKARAAPHDLTIKWTLQEHEINEAMRIIITSYGDNYGLNLHDLYRPHEPKGLIDWIRYLDWCESEYSTRKRDLTSGQRKQLQTLIKVLRFVEGSLTWAEVAAEIPDPVSSRL